MFCWRETMLLFLSMSLLVAYLFLTQQLHYVYPSEKISKNLVDTKYISWLRRCFKPSLTKVASLKNTLLHLSLSVGIIFESIVSISPDKETDTSGFTFFQNSIVILFFFFGFNQLFLLNTSHCIPAWFLDWWWIVLLHSPVTEHQAWLNWILIWIIGYQSSYFSFTTTQKQCTWVLSNYWYFGQYSNFHKACGSLSHLGF